MFRRKPHPLAIRREDRDWVSSLARYNSEKARGIMHTTEWRHRMENLQTIFDARYSYQEDPDA